MYSNQTYKAVSLDYIHKYLLKEKVTKRFVAKILFKLCKDEIILPIPCNHANNLVFCNYEFQKTKLFCKFKVGNNEILNNNYKFDQKWLDNFNIFLK